MTVIVLVCLCTIFLGAANVSAVIDCFAKIKDDDYVDTKIRHKIFCPNYDEDIWPGTKPLKVDFSFKLVSFTFYEEDAKLSTESYISQIWADKRLTWNPSDFNGADRTYASVDELWIPDMTIYDSEGRNDIRSCLDTDCWVYFNGSIECTNPCTHTAYCDNVDYTDWPFDAHHCLHMYISRTRSFEEVYFDSDLAAMSEDFDVMSDDWFLESMKSDKGVMNTYGLRNASHSYVQLHFVVRRQSEAYIHQVFIPALVIVSMNLLLLLLDPRLNERLVLLFINLFSHAVYLEQLHYMLPKNGDSTPKPMIFFLDSRYITVFFIVQTVIMKIFLKRQDAAAPWVKSVVSVVGNKTFTELHIENGTTKKEDPGKLTRNAFRIIFDTFLAGISLVVYGAMFIKLIPLKRPSIGLY